MKLFIAPIAGVFLTACAATGPHQQSKIREIPASEFQAYLDYDLSKKNLISTSAPAETQANWEDTQQKDCKIWVSPGFKIKDPSVAFFWDGECRDGYAYGLGREFTIGKNTYVESIGEYAGGRTNPQYYYEFYKNQKVFILGHLAKDTDERITIERGLDVDNAVMNSIVFEDHKNKEKYRNLMVATRNMHASIYHSAGGLNITYRNYQDDPVIKEDMYIKLDNKELYGFQSGQNGSKQFADLSTSPSTLANPPASMKQFIGEKLGYLQNDFAKRHQDAVNRFNLASKKVDQYINSACTSKPVTGIDKDTFYAICSPNKSLSLFQIQIDQGIAYINQQKLQRLEQAKQSAIQQQIAAQQAQNNARRAEEDWLATLGAISSASNSVANSYYQRAQATSNMANNMGQVPYTVPSFGLNNNRKMEFNCFSFGQNTNCRER